MAADQDRNRNQWAQLTQDDYFQSVQQQIYSPEGYAPVQEYGPVQGYAPAETQTSYSDYQGSTASPYDTHQTQTVNPYTVDDDDDNIPEEEIRDFVSSQRQKRKSRIRAKPKEDQPISKRGAKRATIAKEHQGEVSSKDTPKGLVELRDGVLKWWDPEDHEWKTCAFHDTYRNQFLREDSAEGSYAEAPDRGKGASDVTSFCAAFNQEFWRLKDRNAWGNIVDADNNPVLYLLERPEYQSYDEPERLWMHDGCVLLDGDNNPVRPWAGVPRCFSSKIEGGRMEALRRIMPMSIQDFRARMLREVPTGAGHGAATKPLSLPSTFGHRLSRFRAEYQCPSWLARAASAILKKQVTALLPEAEEATTTEGLQPLSRYEIEQRKLLTRGKFLYKANGRAISEQERMKRWKKQDQKLARQAFRQPKNLQQPQSMPATPWQSASPSPYLPTPPLSAGNKRHWENDGPELFDGDQSGYVAKKGRLSSAEDPFQQPSNFYSDSTNFSTFDPQQGQPGLNAVGLGSYLGGGNSVIHQYPDPSQMTSVPEPYPLQNEATYTEATAFTNALQIEDNFQLDYRFVVPRNSLEQLSIQAALSYPRKHYHALTGEYPPHTSDGTYGDQFVQLLLLLEQKWMGPGGVPLLADVGQWNGSFSIVPTPNLPDEVLEILLRPNVDAPPAAEPSTHTVDVEHIKTTSKSNTGSKYDGGPSDWSDDLFGEYIEDFDD